MNSLTNQLGTLLNEDIREGNCINQLFEQQVRLTPNAPAVYFEERQLTYIELNEKADQLAVQLRSHGVKPEARVGLCLARSPEWIVSLLAVLKAGGAFVPLDPTYPTERLNFMVQDAQPCVVLTQSSWQSRFPNSVPVLILSPELNFTEAGSLSAGQHLNDSHRQTQLVKPQNLAYVIYTSGSTGKPKGVLIEHQGVCNLARAQIRCFGLEPHHRVLQFASPNFDASISEVFITLCSGASLYLTQQETLLPGPGLVQFLQNHAITHLTIPPSVLTLLPEADMPDLQVIIVAGEACPPGLVDRWAKGRKFFNAYGPTEFTVCATVACLTPGQVPVIGRPIDNVQVYLLPESEESFREGVSEKLSDNLQFVPEGEVGELFLGGVQVARGYLNQTELTQDRFIANPFGEGRLYRTGDRARYRPDGNLEFIGRIDDQVKIRGFRIELGEVEAVLRQHPAVHDAVAVVKATSNGEQELLVYATPQASVDDAEQSELVHQWEQISDETYRQKAPSADPTFNTIGWNDSYSGQPIAQAEMQEWVEQTARRILTYRPERVLEIGCGTGMLLSRIAPYCKSYVGTDISQAALKYIERQIINSNLSNQLNTEWSHVRLLHTSADDIEGLSDQEFDTVIINSVIQHFPSAEYLVRVLKQVVERVAPGGTLFVGDVRNLLLQEAFHTSIQLYQAFQSLEHPYHLSPEPMTVEELWQRIQKSIAWERQLVVAPNFFYALQRQLPQIQQVQIHLKRGGYHNELTRFRYDVVLKVGIDKGRFSEDCFPENGTQQAAQFFIDWHNWQQEALSFERIRQILNEQQPKILGIQQIPNARLAGVKAVLAKIKSYSAQNEVTVTQLCSLQQAPPEPGIDPEEWWRLSDEFPYQVQVLESNEGFYNVLIHRDENLNGFQILESQADLTSHINYSDYTNNPLQHQVANHLNAQLRQYLRQHLPDYLMPSAVIVLTRFPLTPSGKIDRHALPLPQRSRPSLETDLVLPDSNLEQQIAQVWQKVLQLDVVGIHDNFFDLGGHSLLIVQVYNHLRSQIAQSTECFHSLMNLSLVDLFQYPTIHTLSQYLSQSCKKTASTSQPGGTTREQRKAGVQRQRQRRKQNRDTDTNS